MNLGNIRDSARTKADERETNFLSNTELNRFINQGYKYVYGKIVESFEDYFLTEGDAVNGGLFNTVVGTAGYALPNLTKLVKVEFRQSGSQTDNDYRRIERANIANDRMDEYYPIREGYRPGFGYYITGDKLYIRPVPANVFQLRLWFVPRVVDLVADSDTPIVPDEYHELIADYAAARVLAASGESLFTEHMNLFNSELANLIQNIEIRNQQSEQMVVTDDSDFYRNGF